MKTAKLPDTGIFFRIIDAAYKHGSFKLTKRIFEHMVKMEVFASNEILIRYFTKQNKDFKMRQKDFLNRKA